MSQTFNNKKKQTILSLKATKQTGHYSLTLEPVIRRCVSLPTLSKYAKKRERNAHLKSIDPFRPYRCWNLRFGYRCRRVNCTCDMITANITRRKRKFDLLVSLETTDNSGTRLLNDVTRQPLPTNRYMAASLCVSTMTQNLHTCFFAE